MNLSAPTTPIFIASLIIALLALAVKFAGLNIPVVSGNTFEVMTLAYVILMGGVLLKNV